MHRYKVNNVVRNLGIILILLFVSRAMEAQDREIKASAPAVVQVGKAFNYSLSGEVQGRVKLPEMKGIRIIAGPGQSITSQSSNINGRLQSVLNVTYTYVLIIDEEGEYDIPAASITAGGKELLSNALHINAIKGTSQVKSTVPEGNATPTVMIRQIPSKKELYLGEQLVVETKVYVREQLRITGVTEPHYTGFWREEIDPDDFVQRETFNGVSYRTQVIKRDLLTAQKTGNINIEPAKMEVMLRKKLQSRSPSGAFDDIFNDPFFRDPFERYQDVPASYNSNELSIKVKPLPDPAPASFRGAVGRFNFSARLSRDSSRTNESVVLKINIEGKGNLDLIEAPKIDFPPDLEVFDPKESSNIKHSQNGASGNLSFEYLIIPRSRGTFRIAPVEFSWFDPTTGKYKTDKSAEFNLEISGEGTEAGEGEIQQMQGGFFREDVKNIENDIRYIKAKTDLKKKGQNIVHSPWMLLYPLGVVLFIVILLIRRNSLKRRADIYAVRNRKARKVAGRRLSNARNLMNAGDEHFYEEVLKTFWGYLSDKLGIKTSDLSRESINRKLKENMVKEETITELWQLLDDCEYSRYAPGEGSDKKTLYNRAEKCLSAIEQEL